MKSASKKPQPKKRIIILFIAIPLIALIGLFVQSKYLDRNNVQEMKELLASFQDLEKEAEKATGEDFTIEADCSSVGKFSDSYACTLDLKPVSESMTIEMISFFSQYKPINHDCGLYANLGYVISDESKNYYGCKSFKIRQVNEQYAESIFYDYDTTPGRAF